MSLLQRWVDHWRANARIGRLAEQLAPLCAGEVRSHLSGAPLEMSLYECRGYIRARALGIVQRVADEAGHRRGISPRLLPALQALVLEATTRLVVREMWNPPSHLARAA
jgi:hypothetical protein